MMPPKEVIAHVFAEPFQPFRINMASGRTFDVRHPELVKVGRNSLTIYSFPDGENDNGQHWQDVSIVLIESIEPLDMTIGSNNK